MKNQRFRQILTISAAAFLILSGMSCNPEQERIDIQGHRGCRGLFPENSLPAFEKAIDLGVNTLELDIVISKDQQVVVSHEPFMNPLICYDLKGDSIPDSLETHYNLYQMNYDEIRQFDCGSKFHPSYPDQEKLKTYKPLLSEVFDLVKAKHSNVKFNIEIKSEPNFYGEFTPEPKAYVSLVLDEIKKNGMLNRVNLQSFDLAILEEIKNQSPTMKVAMLVEDNETIEEKLDALSYQPEIISPYFKLLTAESVRDFQSEGFQIIPWTINEEKDMRQMIEWNVDGIITDYPDKLIAILRP
ncbi:glycerophosphodiester phosphodiesterase [Winogradskyella forsetii]|uniref:glycerophosphodiester phosphodiesterase n=1 Tax=Winogradskyella forsetii TaxID=2686077 RepID=UPI0021180279|nr:glycerophosphodiester phosphodiesterase [Winogradskyella forsetii]